MPERIRLIQPPLVQPRYRQLTLPVVGALFASQGLEVEACDENVEDLDTSPVDLVGITCHVYNAPRAFELARGFRQRGARVIIGGTFATTAPDLVAPHCDAVVAGELEDVVEEVVRDARGDQLRGLYRASDAAAHKKPAPNAAPDWSLLETSKYFRFNFPLETSRGCRFACGFCTSGQLWPTPRTRPLADIERDLQAYDHGQVELVDVNFLNDADFFRSVLPVLKRAPIPGWLGQTTVADLEAPDLPERFADSRCRAVFVGLESIDADALKSINKDWNRAERFKGVVKRYQDVGVLVQAGLIVGLDGQNAETFRRTLDFLDECQVHAVSITYLHHNPGSPQFAKLQAAGRLHSEDWRDYDGTVPTIQPIGSSVAELERAVEEFLRQLYRPRSIWSRGVHRGTLRHPSQLAHHFMINLSLKTYYEESAADRRARYGGRRGPEKRLEKWLADGASALLERFWRP
ncbi:MAG: hypothetical protein AUK47_15360 [Deltaproteobacteria bacterium CG2_30_63_29]|nr:MAG: hypothetical protein AUK47_15360 [Deltaproteobacteria bacterium CG2_30_63_29]